MINKQKLKYEAMICSNDHCDVWYRIGSHFFLTCPSCQVPMIKTEKEVEKTLKII